MNNVIKISNCSWPIPDETSESEHIENCCNFARGCWQCVGPNDVCWCYMIKVWGWQGLEFGEVKVQTDLNKLKRQIESGRLKLKSNLGVSSSHDPLHEDCVETFREFLSLFQYGIDNYERVEEFFNGHVMHIVTKKPLRLLGLIDLVPPDVRIWATITTPDKKQSREYAREADTPFDIAFALRQFKALGWHDLGVSFGPCFGEWRNLDKTTAYLNTLPELKMAQFEPMNHGDHGLDVLNETEVEILAHLFKQIQPDCKVYLKTEGPYKVGKLLE